MLNTSGIATNKRKLIMFLTSILTNKFSTLVSRVFKAKPQSDYLTTLSKVNNALTELYSLKRDSAIWNEETSRLLSRSIDRLETLEETLINNRSRLQDNLFQEIVKQQLYLVFAESTNERKEIESNLNEAISQLEEIKV